MNKLYIGAMGALLPFMPMANPEASANTVSRIPACTMQPGVVAAKAAVDIIACTPDTTIPPVIADTIPTPQSDVPDTTTADEASEPILISCPENPKYSKEITTDCRNNVKSYLGEIGLKDPDSRLQVIAAQKLMGFPVSEQQGTIGPKTVKSIQSNLLPSLDAFSAEHNIKPYDTKAKLGFVVDQSLGLSFIFNKGKAVEAYTVTTGLDDKTPDGDFPITRITNNPAKTSVDNPEWHLGMPIYFKDGKAFHYSYAGENVSNKMITGQKGSHGCVRTGEEQLKRVHAMVSKTAGITWPKDGSITTVESSQKNGLGKIVVRVQS